MRLATLLFLAWSLRAEFLRIQVTVHDMDCQSCSASLESIFKRMRGVESAEVDYKAGTILISLGPQNRISVEQIWDAVKRVGFTPAETKVQVRVVVAAGKIEVQEANRSYALEGHAAEGKAEIKGSMSPPSDPRTPIVLRVE